MLARCVLNGIPRPTGVVGGPHADTLELLDINLRDVHANVLELDDDITDSLETGYAGGRKGALRCGTARRCGRVSL